MDPFQVTIKLSKVDKDQLDNIVRLISKAQMDLKGIEVLPAANSLRWLIAIQAHYEQELKKSLAPKPIEIKETKEPFVATTQPKQNKPKKEKNANS